MLEVPAKAAGKRVAIGAEAETSKQRRRGGRAADLTAGTSRSSARRPRVSATKHSYVLP